MTDYLFGLGSPDVMLAVTRVSMGLFFAISGAHKLFNRERHAGLVKTLKEDKIPAVGFMQWWVPGWEFTAGLAMIVGLASVPAALVLSCIMCVACWSEAKPKVDSYQPIDAADRLDDYLYLPEVLYLVLLSVTIISGPGAYSLDHWLFGG